MSDLADLLRTSRRNNKRLGVTGILLYRDRSFLQVLEGREQSVSRLYQRIRSDERHEDVTTLIRAPADARSFSEWAMDFKVLGALEHADVPGFTSSLDEEAILSRLSNESGPASTAVQRFLEASS